MAFWSRTKAIDTITEQEPGHRLSAALSWPHLMALGVGAIVGTGIYTLIGVGAKLAGPAVMLSFIIAGLVSACAALCYAEMATLMPAAGSAYTYSYAVLGELLAWIVGWSLILEYTVVCSVVAVGWSAHVAAFVPFLPHAVLAGPEAEGVVNLPAVLICFVVAGLLVAGTRASATVTLVLVLVKLAALIAFLVVALPAFDPGHFQPFAPNGFSSTGPDGVKTGVMGAASIIFFAFYGFDTISTAAEETKNPGRDLIIGIVGSMLLCVAIYVAVAAAAIGAVRTDTFADDAAPLVLILHVLHHPSTAKLVAGAAVLALPTVILAFMYGQSRICFVMARDGLLPRSLARVSSRTGTPVQMTAITAVIAAVLSGLLPLGQVAALANSGTLCAFIAVGVCTIVLRIREPDRPRSFRAPLWWVVAPAAVAGCAWLFTTLPTATTHRFFGWNAVGMAVYLFYGRKRSRLS